MEQLIFMFHDESRQRPIASWKLGLEVLFLIQLINFLEQLDEISTKRRRITMCTLYAQMFVKRTSSLKFWLGIFHVLLQCLQNPGYEQAIHAVQGLHVSFFQGSGSKAWVYRHVFIFKTK